MCHVISNSRRVARGAWRVARELRLERAEHVTSYKLQATTYKIQVTSHKPQFRLECAEHAPKREAAGGEAEEEVHGAARA